MRRSITYQELFESIEQEGTVSLEDVSAVIKTLDDDFDGDDYGETNYNRSPRKKARELAQRIREMSIKIYGDPDDYHNLAVDYARRNWYDGAIWILERGLKETPYSLDLLADTILYGIKSGQRDVSKEAYNKLTRIDQTEWRWRSYSFTIDYYLDKAQTIPGGKTRRTLQNLALSLADRFLSYALNHSKEDVDRAYFKKASVVKAFGGEGAADAYVTILQEGCMAADRTPQCLLGLADHEFECGKYQESVIHLKKCEIAVNSAQPDVNQAYFYLLSALAKTSQLIKETPDGIYSARESEVKDIYKYFHTAMAQKDINPTYEAAAKRTIKVLEIQTGFKDDSCNSDEEEYI